MQSHMDTRRSIAPYPQTFEIGRNDPGIVDDEPVTRPQERWKIANETVFKTRFSFGSYHQKAGRVARGRRTQSDAIRREFEIEEVDTHERERRPPML